MDPQSFIARAEAQRWIGIAEKLLMSHDLVGSKTFAIRARESDPRLQSANQILAIIDTLIAAEKQIITNNNTHQPDYYAMLQVNQFVQDVQHITSQYQRLGILLNPNENRFPYSEQAFELVNDAWAVLSNPMRKSIYDSELNHYMPHQQHQQQVNSMGFDIEQQQHNFFTVSSIGSNRVETSHQQQHNFMSQSSEQEQMYQQQFQQTEQPPQPPQPPFSWPQAPMAQPQQQQQNETLERNNAVNGDSACPYCLYMFEYPKMYVNCTLRCDNCKRASQAVRVKSPPAIVEGQEAYFYCWGFFPVGVSMENLKKSDNRGARNSNWNPFSPLYDVSSSVKDNLNEKAAPKKNARNSGPRVYIDDETDDIFTGVSEPSDDSDHEWGAKKKKEK
ncbi:hypothetical protein CTI12_AA332910 [Artemisia annua]|uniref:J domain-containing protein n=1 Tax=Artemisia annua TaxID=35608 RepID=A0A2U1MYC6_ARTAN|nr:hypothetical protein CTI12_AA332910 [Artemisia annua]